MTTTQTDKADRFLELHRPGHPLLMPNAWDLGSAALLASLGFEALATTSSGHAATLGRLDGGVTRDEALAHASELARGTDLPVSADLENAFADDPAGVAQTIGLAVQAGLAGCSVEDYSGGKTVRSMTSASPASGWRPPSTSHTRGRSSSCSRHARRTTFAGVDDLADTIARLQAYQEVGADVLFAPGLKVPEDIRRVVESVERPVSVLAVPGAPSVAELAALGVARISVGGAFAFAALAALCDAAQELRENGTYGYLERSAAGAKAARSAFAD